MDITKISVEEDEKPPFLGSWQNVYLFLIANLMVLILLFYLFTQNYS